MSSPRVLAARASSHRPVASAVVLKVLVVLALLVSALPSAPAEADSGWLRPVPGAVVNPFRAPLARFGPGHRGVDFAAAPGTPVRAANDGRVVFAGTVAGAQHVVVAHPNGIRTTYSYLVLIDVHTGLTVLKGQVIGVAGGRGEGHGPGVLHFGARIGDRYIDPMLLFGPTDLTQLVRLVPVAERDALDHSYPLDEARALAQALHDDGNCAGGLPVIEQACDVVSYGIDKGGDLLEAAIDAGIWVIGKAAHLGAALVKRLAHTMRAIAKLIEDAAKGIAGAAARIAELAASGAVAVFNAVVELGKRIIERLTSCPQPPPVAHPNGSGNIVVAVGGLGSSRRLDRNGVMKPSFHFEASVLGYQPADVTYYSYDPTTPTYTPEETFGDLHAKAKLLGAQIRAAAAAHPGRAIDLVAHSQGGVVVDLFLMEVYRGHESEYPPIRNVVTFASPHEGTPLADLGKAAQALPFVGHMISEGQRELAGRSLDQLREGSPTIKGLWEKGDHLPANIRFLSIVGSEDPFVPSTSGDAPGAEKIVVPVGDVLVPDDHSGILRDDDALSAAQAELSGGHPVHDCGIFTDAGGELYSDAVRVGTAATRLVTG
jgi:peptidase M23-like protein/putative serine esterase DUF676